MGCLMVTGSALAQSAQPERPQKQFKARSTLPESVRRVERQTGGEVLRAEPMQRDGREVYRLKVLTADGRVRVVQDDPSEADEGDRGNDRRDRQRDKQKESSRDSDEAPPQY